MPKLRSITELLERAVELCPDRFRYKRVRFYDSELKPTDQEYDEIQVLVGPEFRSVADRFDDATYILEPIEEPHAFILAAVVGAANERDWLPQVHGLSFLKEHYQGALQSPLSRTGTRRTLGEGTGYSMGHALLAAFIAALETQTKK